MNADLLYNNTSKVVSQTNYNRCSTIMQLIFYLQLIKMFHQ